MIILNEWYSLVRFSSGHRISVYNQIRPLAEERSHATLLRHIDRAKAHDMHTCELETRWEATSGRNQYPEELIAIDNLVDRTLTGTRDVAVAQIKGLPAGHPLTDRVERFLHDVFPAGVGAITSLPFIEQVAATEIIVAKMQTEHAALVRELGLAGKVAYLAELTAAYRDQVDNAPRPVDFATVNAARERGHAYLLEIISIILGTYHDEDEPEHAAAREELLAPIQAHEKTIRAELRARRARGSAAADHEPASAEPTPHTRGNTAHPATHKGTDAFVTAN